MKLESALKNETGRCARPEDTVARLEAAFEHLPNLQYQEHQVAEHLFWGSLTTDALAFPPMGKGASSLLCKASTLAETAEWLALGRVRELPGHVEAGQSDVPHSLPVEALLAHIATATPEVLERIQGGDKARHWVDGFSLGRNETVKTPLEYLQGISGANGMAAGNRLEEAIVQGINEVFERRAAITIVKNRVVVPTIAKASIKNVRALEQIESIEAMGIEVIIKDFSLGGVMPCIGVCFIDASIPEGVQPRHVLKVGSHFDREAALTGCLTEYAQIAKLNQRGGEPEHDYEGLLNSDEADNFLPLFWFGYVPFASVDFLREGETVDFDPGTRFDDCLEDIEQALTICGHLGKDCVVVDLTDPDIGFPVVQVIVPGYSDILPYHPPDSSVLFTGWTREMPMGYYRDADGNRKPCTAKGFFPDW